MINKTWMELLNLKWRNKLIKYLSYREVKIRILHRILCGKFNQNSDFNDLACFLNFGWCHVGGSPFSRWYNKFNTPSTEFVNDVEPNVCHQHWKSGNGFQEFTVTAFSDILPVWLWSLQGSWARRFRPPCASARCLVESTDRKAPCL